MFIVIVVVGVARVGETAVRFSGGFDESAREWFSVVDREPSTPLMQIWAYCKYELVISDSQADLLYQPIDYPLDRVWLVGALASFRYQDVYVKRSDGEQVPVRLSYTGNERYTLVSSEGNLPLRSAYNDDATEKDCQQLRDVIPREQLSYLPPDVEREGPWYRKSVKSCEPIRPDSGVLGCWDIGWND